MEFTLVLIYVSLAFVLLFFIWFMIKFIQKKMASNDGAKKYPWISTPIERPEYVIKANSGVKIIEGSCLKKSAAPKPKSCHFCQTSLHSLNRYFCSMCKSYFCIDHRNHTTHQGVYSPKDSALKLSIIDKCMVCGEGLTTLSKVTCLRCFKTFCVKHVRSKKHKCKPLHTGPFQMAGYEYPDGTRVYFPDRKTGPGYRYGKKK